MMTYYKFTYDNLAPLAQKNTVSFMYKMDGGWETPIPPETNLEMCKVGYHVIPSSSMAFHASKDLWEVEVDEDSLSDQPHSLPMPTKFITRNIRFVRKIPTWTLDVYRMFLARAVYEGNFICDRVNIGKNSPLPKEVFRLSQQEGAIFDKWNLVGVQSLAYPVSPKMIDYLHMLSKKDSYEIFRSDWSLLAGAMWYLPNENACEINSDMEHRIFQA